MDGQDFKIQTNVKEEKDVKSALVGINQDLKEEALAKRAAGIGLDYVNLFLTPINPDYLRVLSREKAEEGQCIIYVRIGKKLKIAMVNPEDPRTVSILEELKQQEYTIFPALITEESFRHGLSLYDLHNIQEQREIENMVDESTLDVYEKEIQNLTTLSEKMKSGSTEEGLNLILVGAYKTGASDIHIDPEEKIVHLRFRIDGVIQNITELDTRLYEKIITQIKYSTKMRLNVSNIPQDGRTSFSINKNKIDIRVSTLPTEFGETVVMRLLDKRKGLLDFSALGYEGQSLENLDVAIKKSHGMILVTGPTGSGKTTTLYAILNKLNNPENKIVTLEDPIEYHLENISQSQVNEKVGYDFATGLRAIIRQDPDIIMVGEIRDLETAEIATQAALTGHIVISTLHTNTAVDSIPRLINMGLKPFMIAPAINAIIAQRLVRMVCSKCKMERPLSKEERKDMMSVLQLFPQKNLSIPQRIVQAKTTGCEYCSHTGYKGQIAISEVLLVTDDIKDMIFKGVSPTELYQQVRKNGFMTMREYGMIQVLKGKVTLEEVYRVATN